MPIGPIQYGDTSIRLTHIPSGTTVEMWGHNFTPMSKLKALAMSLLPSKIYSLTLPRNTAIVKSYELPDGVEVLDD
jgi:protein subunit release factor A